MCTQCHCFGISYICWVEWFRWHHICNDLGICKRKQNGILWVYACNYHCWKSSNVKKLYLHETFWIITWNHTRICKLSYLYPSRIIFLPYWTSVYAFDDYSCPYDVSHLPYCHPKYSTVACYDYLWSHFLDNHIIPDKAYAKWKSFSCDGNLERASNDWNIKIWCISWVHWGCGDLSRSGASYKKTIHWFVVLNINSIGIKLTMSDQS